MRHEPRAIDVIERELEDLRAEHIAALQSAQKDLDAAPALRVFANRCAAKIAELTERLAQMRTPALAD